ncbi:MADS-box transcription factor 23-like isoform X5 [Syzygium oleosum]|uniref:MADS-box transcription factor 23-like isoform X5 n=1 Tax=Syzygium oleosum TaxID=219896 RepID=UPI0024B9F49C|nr:MADS-box transcription factor 23-like isoform X5 [Syzygium oleosum]
MNPQSSSGAGLHITFAKRRNSLMKKARDLSRLCDAEVGIIIFSCTGQLHEYSSSSMDSVIERYNNLKREAQPELDQPPVDAKVLEEEIANLNRQLQGLQEYHRQLMGEDISGLSVKDIQNLENQLEISLSTIRLQKEQIMTDQINELHRKRNLIHQKNIELQEKVNLIDKENAEFLEKVLIIFTGKGILVVRSADIMYRMALTPEMIQIYRFLPLRAGPHVKIGVRLLR